MTQHLIDSASYCTAMHHKKRAKIQQRTSKYECGVTLIELMIVMAIVGVLVGLAVPSYQDFILKERRSDARHLLLANDSRLTKCLTLAGSYENNCRLMTTSKQGHYRLDAQITAQSWTISAIPMADGAQSNDTDCQSLTLTNVGRRSATGTQDTHCW